MNCGRSQPAHNTNDPGQRRVQLGESTIIGADDSDPAAAELRRGFLDLLPDKRRSSPTLEGGDQARESAAGRRNELERFARLCCKGPSRSSDGAWTILPRTLLFRLITASRRRWSILGTVPRWPARSEMLGAILPRGRRPISMISGPEAIATRSAA